MEHITLFTDILPEEQERMRICFHAREMTFRNGETIMEYSSSMKKIGLILEGQAVLYCIDEDGNQYMIDNFAKSKNGKFTVFFFLLIHSIIMSVPQRRQKSCLLIMNM